MSTLFVIGAFIAGVLVPAPYDAIMTKYLNQFWGWAKEKYNESKTR